MKTPNPYKVPLNSQDSDIEWPAAHITVSSPTDTPARRTGRPFSHCDCLDLWNVGLKMRREHLLS